MSDSAAVQIAMSMDLSDLERPLEQAELAVMKRYRENMLKFIRKRWTRWKYEGRNLKTTGRSLKGWQGEEQTVEGVRQIRIWNHATGYYTDKPYVAYVARRKGQTPEAEILSTAINDKIVPLLVSDLADAILQTISDAPPKQVRQNTTSKYKSIDIEV